MWTCARCGASFVSRNVWHGCNRNTVDAFFLGKPPELRALFDGFLDLIQRCGPVESCQPSPALPSWGGCASPA
jgi:hypothetical protein